jgi:hypothetical protein
VAGCLYMPRKSCQFLFSRPTGCPGGTRHLYIRQLSGDHHTDDNNQSGSNQILFLMSTLIAANKCVRLDIKRFLSFSISEAQYVRPHIYR